MSSPVGAATVVDARSRRLVGVDLARGLALLGMAATHMLVVQDPSSRDLTPLGWFFAGRASALFALLAGVSLALLSGGRTPPTGRDRARISVTVLVRALLIGLVGLLLAESTTPVAVILAYYAVLFVLALPFLGLRPPALMALAASWALLSPLVSHLLRQQPGGISGQVSVESVLMAPLDSLVELLVTGFYPALTWLTYLLAGLAVGRLDLRATGTAIRVLAAGAALAVLGWAASAALLAGGVAERLTDAGGSWWQLLSDEGRGVSPPEDWGWLVVAAPHTGTTLDLVTTTGSALGVLGVALLVVRVDLVRRLTHPLAAAGAMTFTLYTTHVLVLSQRDWGAFDSVAYYLVHVVVALTFAPLWLRRFRRGPLESVVHELSSTFGRALVPPRDPSPPVGS